jgi:hypothetical protein
MSSWTFDGPAFKGIPHGLPSYMRLGQSFDRAPKTQRYVTNRCELVCLDTKGNGNGNAKVVWKFDVIDEVGSSPHNMSNSSPLSCGDLLFVITANGQDESHVHIPSPRAPSMIAVNKKTG